jgi:hypothetical protein
MFPHLRGEIRLKIGYDIKYEIRSPVLGTAVAGGDFRPITPGTDGGYPRLYKRSSDTPCSRDSLFDIFDQCGAVLYYW